MGTLLSKAFDLKEGWIITVAALVLTGGFLYYTKKKEQMGTK